ncbi:MAG: CpXC domain-containing protein [Thermoflexales bacterium]|nr:CpXC domain-containing protein [Thermoflexales bacterium]
MPFAPVPTPIQCPFCHAPITVPLRQVVDVTEEPGLKNALLAGVLNAFRCSSCGNTASLASPFVYHDADKELAFIFMPMQAGIKEADQQRMIGSMTNAIMSKLPPEKRKAYLLQPKQFFTLQNLVEAILEADGITKEMLAAQRAKMDLLQTLADTPVEQLPALIQEHDAELDEEFFGLVSTALASARASGVANDYEQLAQMRDRLMEHSTVGAKIAAQQKVLEAFAAEPSQATLLDQLAQAPDIQTRKMLVGFGRSLLDYSFFQALTAKIEAATQAGDQDTVHKLTTLRKEIQEAREELDAAARAVYEQRGALLSEMVNSADLTQFARQHLDELDDIFFSVLENNLGLAHQSGQQAVFDRLQAVGQAAMQAIQASQPAEVRFINALMSVDYPDGTSQLLEANRQALGPEFINWMRRVAGDLRNRERAEAADKLDKIIEQAAQMSGQAVAVATK